MISQTSSSPTARRNPYTCQDNMKLLYLFFFRPSSPLSLFKNVPLTNLFLPLHMRGMGCPPSTRSSGARSGGHPTSTICLPHSLTLSGAFQNFPLTQLSMSSVPQSRWKTSPRTRRHRLENKEWNSLKTPILENPWWIIKVICKDSNTCMDQTCVGRPWAHTTPEMKSWRCSKLSKSSFTSEL